MNLNERAAKCTEQDNCNNKWITINEDGSNIPKAAMDKDYIVLMVGPLGYRSYEHALGPGVAMLFEQRPLRAVAYYRCDIAPKQASDIPPYTPSS